MPKKRHKPEEIVAKLRQVDVLVSQGQTVADAIRLIGVTEVSYYRWRREFGGLKSDHFIPLSCGTNCYQTAGICGTQAAAACW